MEKFKVPVTVSIEYRLLEKIDKERKQRDVSRSEVLREIIDNYYGKEKENV